MFWTFLSLYRLPSGGQDDVETVTENFEMSLEKIAQRNPFLVVVMILMVEILMLNQAIGFVMTKLTLKELQLEI